MCKLLKNPEPVAEMSAGAWQVLEGHVGHDSALQERVGPHWLDSHVPGVGRALADCCRQGGMSLISGQTSQSMQ